MKKFFNKKNIIIVSIISALILAIIIFFIVFYTHGNIPRKYRGTWVVHLYSTSDKTERTYNLNIFKNEIEMDSTPRKIEYEIDGNNFIIIYVNPETNEKFKEYILLKDDQLYISQDKNIDKIDTCYYKKGSSAERENQLQARADYYASNIEAFANQALNDTYHTNETISILAITDLTEEQKNKKDDLNYYYAFYNTLSNTVEISINRTTGKLEDVTYTENLSSYNTSDTANLKTTSALYGICCLTYADDYNIDNINTAEKLDNDLAKLYGSTVVANTLKKVFEEQTYVTSFETDKIRISLRSPVNKTSGTMSISVRVK